VRECELEGTSESNLLLDRVERIWSSRDLTTPATKGRRKRQTRRQKGSGKSIERGLGFGKAFGFSDLLPEVYAYETSMTLSHESGAQLEMAKDIQKDICVHCLTLNTSLG
jgi:hypothetical protein